MLNMPPPRPSPASGRWRRTKKGGPNGPPFFTFPATRMQCERLHTSRSADPIASPSFWNGRARCARSLSWFSMPCSCCPPWRIGRTAPRSVPQLDPFKPAPRGLEGAGMRPPRRSSYTLDVPRPAKHPAYAGHAVSRSPILASSRSGRLSWRPRKGPLFFCNWAVAYHRQ